MLIAFFYLGLEIIMDKLIKLSPNIDVNPFNKRTPIHLAAEFGMLNLLL